MTFAPFILIVLSLLVACATLYGWGMIARLVGRVPEESRAVTITLGLAAVLTIGGVVNVLKVAFAPALLLIASIGFVVGIACRWLAPQAFINYNHYALSQAAEDEIRSLQSKIPIGEPLVTWVSQPFHLDFRRNQIFDVDQAGLATPWAVMPPQVAFVLWEYKGYGVGTPQNFIAGAQVPGRHEQLIALSALAFGTALNARAKDGEIVYYDDRFVLYRLRTE